MRLAAATTSELERLADLEQHGSWAQLCDPEAADISNTRASWPEPEALMPDKARQQPFPVDALGVTMARAVHGIASKAYVPASLAAQSVLAACSLAVQPHFNVMLPTGQVRPTSLFLVSIAESGDRKSTSDDLAMAAIREFEHELEDEYVAQKSSIALQQSAWDEAKRAITQRVKNQGRAALEAAYIDLGARPEGPPEPTMIIRTGTTQGLLKRFLTTRPSLGLMSDEGGSWLGGYGMSDDNRLATIATLSDFWDGKTVQTLTSGEGYTALRGRRLTFHLMVQPIVADRLLGDAEALGQGFLSRLLVSHPESLAGSRFVDPEAVPSSDQTASLQAFHQRLSRIIRAPLRVDDSRALNPTALHLSDRACGLWWDFYNEIEAQLGPDGELQSVKGFVGKLPEMAARMAANVTVFEQGVQATEIDALAIDRGIALARFYLSEALRLFGHTRHPAIYEDAQKLSDWLRTKWDEKLISVTAISARGPSAFRNRSDYIRDMIVLLTRHNHLTELPSGGMVSGKKARVAWRVVVGRG